MKRRWTAGDTTRQHNGGGWGYKRKHRRLNDDTRVRLAHYESHHRKISLSSTRAHPLRATKYLTQCGLVLSVSKTTRFFFILRSARFSKLSAPPALTMHMVASYTARCSCALPSRSWGCSRSSRASFTSRRTSATAAYASSAVASSSWGASPNTAPRSPPLSAVFSPATLRTSVVVSTSSSGGARCSSIGTSMNGTYRSRRVTAASIRAGSRNTLPRDDSVTALLHSLLPPQRFQKRTFRSSARVVVPLSVPPTVHLPPPCVRPSPVELSVSSLLLSIPTLASTRAVTVRIAPPAAAIASRRRALARASLAAAESSRSGGGARSASKSFAATTSTRSAKSPCSRRRCTKSRAASRGVRSWSAAGWAASALATPPPSPHPFGTSRGVTAGLRKRYNDATLARRKSGSSKSAAAGCAADAAVDAASSSLSMSDAAG
ncbi:predicted protein [Micromonas commoda]|uniref:Uncharacterized protein n=1 Tax=Micromonas commoda (strain RCC299 / NOUM17 / CCMP2709) TaxID=296587 RepID=C1EDW2_MICCC|nr:predicted protein [Micromonas commoda]ACO66126.1 predicted protein [Micromonas commoda]|eukprot:XP_002504868.1 predicted protein [Micromonas commoda]